MNPLHPVSATAPLQDCSTYCKENIPPLFSVFLPNFITYCTAKTTDCQAKTVMPCMPCVLAFVQYVKRACGVRLASDSGVSDHSCDLQGPADKQRG